MLTCFRYGYCKVALPSFEYFHSTGELLIKTATKNVIVTNKAFVVLSNVFGLTSTGTSNCLSAGLRILYNYCLTEEYSGA